MKCLLVWKRIRRRTEVEDVLSTKIGRRGCIPRENTEKYGLEEILLKDNLSTQWGAS